jgi:hypothetical protein
MYYEGFSYAGSDAGMQVAMQTRRLAEPAVGLNGFGLLNAVLQWSACDFRF